MAIKAVMTPAMPKALNFSPNIRTPIKTVAKRLITDQIVPTIDNWFFCKIAGSQANTPNEYTATMTTTNVALGYNANFFDKNSPAANNKPDKISQIK